jgi:predicted transcriptional regulator
MELYNDILKAIMDEITNDDSVAKPTRVQLRSNLAYERIINFILEMDIKYLDTYPAF